MERDERGGETVRLGEEDVIFGEDVWPGRHRVLAVDLDGALQQLDGLNHLVYLRPQRLELRRWQRRGRHWRC